MPPTSNDTDAEAGSGPTVGWFELFYDLVVVAAVSLCNDAYLAEPSPATALAALLSMAALSWVWFLTTLLNNLYPSDDLRRRLLLLLQMACIVVAGLSVDQVHGLSNGLGLLSYAGALVIIAFGLVQAVGLRGHRRMLSAGVVPLVGSAAVCAVGAFLPIEYSGLVLFVALAISVTAVMTARLDETAAGTRMRADHLRERRGLFILIILGEGFAQLVQALHGTGSIPRGGVFALTFLLSFALWWIYFDGTFSERGGHSVQRWRLSLLAHLTLIYGMAGTMDILVVLTAHEEGVIGDSTLLYFTLCLATVLVSFAVLGLTVRGRLGLPGWAQIGSAALAVVAGVIAARSPDDLSVWALVSTCAALVIGNAVFAVWYDHAEREGRWGPALKHVIDGAEPQ